MSEFSDFISNLLAKTDIVSLVSRYVSLQKKGGTHWGCCPLHHEKTPSFSVSENKQLFYCFGCQTGGNAITFLSKIESIDNIDAIKTLADWAGLKMPEKEFNSSIDSSQKKQRQEHLKNLLKDAALYYHKNLKIENNLASLYLKNRNIDSNIITRFGLGHSHSFDGVITHLEKLNYTKKDMLDAGLISQKADKYYDNFALRLIVPIIDIKGSIIGFGGRILKDEDFAKYKNSPQSEIFDKSKTLFAINLVKKKKQKEPLKAVIIVEGYMDAIALHKAGFDMTLASMGTALTINQARQIKNLVDNCYISFDGDISGQKAALKSLDILEDAGLKIKVISLPDKLDPDDVINKYGVQHYKQLIKDALELTLYKLHSLKNDYDLTSPDGKSAYAVEAVSIIKKHNNPIEWEEYLKIVQNNTGYPMQVLRKQADLHIVEEDAPIVPSQHLKPKDDKLLAAKEFVLSSIIAAKPYANTSEDIFSLLDDGNLQRIYCLINECLKADMAQGGAGEWGTHAWGHLHQSLINNYDQQDIDVITRLASYQHIDGDDADKFIKSILSLKINLIDKEIASLHEEYDRTKDMNLVIKINTLTKEKHELK